jgi:hypothetical protein
MSSLIRHPLLARATAGAFAAALVVAGHPAPSLAASEAEYSCRYGETVRRVELRFAGEGGRMPCEVVYWRDTEQPGQSEVLWHAQRDAQFCRDKTREVVGRLQAGGWRCEAIKAPEAAGLAVARPEEAVVPALAPAARLSLEDFAAAVEADVRRLNQFAEHGRFEATAFTLGDLDRDDAADGAALLTYQGDGAASALYLLAYLHDGQGFRPAARTRLAVGEGSLEAGIEAIEGGVIRVELHGNGSGEGEPREASFLLIDDELVEAGEARLSAGRETTIR